MKRYLFFIGCALIILSCKSNSRQDASAVVANPTLPTKTITQNPTWDDQAVMYEVNIRQYTKEGTFNAFANHVDRLAKMGVDIIWLMPIFPISTEKRKGSLGSYYSVSNFMETNPEFGSKDDFKNLVDRIHAAGMKVIIDWVPNHTGWGHVWIKEHPDFYTKDSAGNIIDPIDPATGKSWGWTDVADLNYDNPDMRKEQIKEMEYWINSYNLDGMRYDVAHNVPADFWRTVSDSLRTIRPMLLLGESEVPQFLNDGSLDCDYGWDFHHLFNEIAQGKQHASMLDTLLMSDHAKNLKGYHINFTSNHDENSWNGTEFERMKEAAKTMAVIAFTVDGMPLLYSGQEEPLKRRLKFFDKDSIGFKKYEYAPFYKALFDLKHHCTALANGATGITVKKLSDNKDSYAFMKTKDSASVVVITNLSKKPISIQLDQDIPEMKEIFTAKLRSFKKGEKLTLKPWEYQVYSN